MAKGATKPKGPPSPASGMTTINGQKVSGAAYDKKKNRYTTSIDMTGPDKQLYTQGQQGLVDLLPSITGALGTTPEDRLKFTDELFAPQARALNDRYDTATDNAVSRFNAQGGLNSSSMGDYVGGVLEKQRQGDLKDLYNEATTQSYDLPMLKLQPLAAGYDLFDQSVSGPFARAMQTLDPSFQGQQVGTNQAMTNWKSQPAPQKKGNFWSSFYDPLNTMGMR